MNKNMIQYLILFLAFIFAGSFGFCSDFQVVDTFDSSANWSVALIGAGNSTVAVSNDCLEGKGALNITFRPDQATPEQLKLTYNANLNLSIYERLEFWVKGLAPREKFYIALRDSSGKEAKIQFNPAIFIEDISKPAWRRITVLINPKELKDIDFRNIVSISIIITDEISPRSTHAARLLIDYMGLFKGNPPDNHNFRYPDELKAKKDNKLKALYIREPLESVKKRWQIQEIIKSMDNKAEIKEVIWSYIPYKYTAELTGYFPSFYSEMAEYDILALQTTDLTKREHEIMVKDYLEGGGSVLILGGYASLGKSLEGTILNNIIPVVTTGPWDMAASESEEVAINNNSEMLEGLDLNNFPVAPWHQKTKPKENAKVILKIGNDPLLITWPYGSGRVVVLTADALGEDAGYGKEPLWKWNNYKKLMLNIIKYLTGGIY